MDILKFARIGKLIIMLIPFLLIFIAAISCMKVSNVKNKRSFRDRLKKVRGYLIPILVIAIVYAACFSGIRIVQGKMEGSVTIGLNYAEASRGLNPNGTRFISYDILEDEVLEKAIEDGHLGDVSVKQLRESLSVEPLHAGGVSTGEQYYLATEYVLQYVATSNTKRLDGNTVIKSVADAYADIFNQRYSRKTNILELDFSSLDKADYLDKVDILNSYASNVKEYLWMCNEENTNFKSESGETFASLATKIGDFQNVELERLEAYILTKGLSLNQDDQIAKLNYGNMIKDFSYQKNIKSYEIRLETVDMYARDMASIVLVPTVDEKGEFYIGRTKIAVDNFANEAEQISQNASKVESDIANNNYAVDQLSHSEAGDSEYKTADSMIASMKETLEAYASKGKSMVKEFDAERKGEFLTFTSESFSVMDISLIGKAGIMFVLMLSALVIFVAARPEKGQTA